MGCGCRKSHCKCYYKKCCKRKYYKKHCYYKPYYRTECKTGRGSCGHHHHHGESCGHGGYGSSWGGHDSKY